MFRSVSASSSGTQQLRTCVLGASLCATLFSLSFLPVRPMFSHRFSAQFNCNDNFKKICRPDEAKTPRKHISSQITENRLTDRGTTAGRPRDDRGTTPGRLLVFLVFLGLCCNFGSSRWADIALHQQVHDKTEKNVTKGCDLCYWV